MDQDSDLEAISDSHSDRVPISFDDLQETLSGSESHPTHSEARISENQSHRETVCAVRSLLSDNLWTGSRSQPSGKVSVAMPADN